MKIIIRVPETSRDIGTDATHPDIPIHYIPLDETEYTLDIPSRTRIETLRNIIRDRENLPIIPDPGIRIIFNGRFIGLYVWENSNSLLDYGISENSVINISFRVRG